MCIRDRIYTRPWPPASTTPAFFSTGSCSGVLSSARWAAVHTLSLIHIYLLVTKEYGVYHCTGEGVCSWCEFAAEIIRLSGIPATVRCV